MSEKLFLRIILKAFGLIVLSSRLFFEFFGRKRKINCSCDVPWWILWLEEEEGEGGGGEGGGEEGGGGGGNHELQNCLVHPYE